jgi:hypothetical protein
MPLSRGQADHQVLGHFAVRHACANQHQDFTLTR